jgi:hypothetical protein
MSSALTKRIVLTAVPKDRPYELWDAQVRGLILRVQLSGHKAWIVTWAHGKRRTLGSVEHLSLDQGRGRNKVFFSWLVKDKLLAQHLSIAPGPRTFRSDRARLKLAQESEHGARHARRAKCQV